MYQSRAWIRLALVLVLALAVINVPPWLMYKGNTIVSVCAQHQQPLQVPEQQQQAHVESQGLDQESNIVPAQDLEEIPVQDPLQVTMNEHETLNSTEPAALETPVQSQDPSSAQTPQVDPLEPASSPPTSPGVLAPPRSARPINTYYVRLSADPGTDEARIQHVAVTQALKALPGKVTIRQEFGMDEDDVLNVISFKLEGDRGGLEDVAALEGVIGIYPVRTRKRPKAVPLGSLKLTRPTLESAHVLTGISYAHDKLGLTGKGIKIGIIDTGVDYKHPALGGCFGKGCKVAFGYDFVGDDYDNGNSDKDTPKPDGDPLDTCNGHGTHVAGIIGAKNEGLGPMDFVGVAPEATLGAYRVFGCEGEVSDDVLLAALKMAYRDGMDVVNLSLGGSSGWPEEPFATACSAYIQKGLHLSIANGNDGEEGLFEDGAPATATGAIAVGSVDNTHFLGPAAEIYLKAPGGRGRDPSRTPFSIGMAMGANAADIPLASFKSDTPYAIYVPSTDDQGCAKYPSVIDSLGPRQNTLVLIRRGGCTFSDKAQNVMIAKLGGMLVYDTIPEQRPLGMSISGYNISAAGLSFEDASAIIEASRGQSTNPVVNAGTRLMAQFSSKDQVLKLASGGKISDFSSWGPDARLRYKPDLITPGGMIYSTFPLAKGGFATQQGTSMASPYMAGIQALFLAKYGKTDPSLLLNILQSTAVPTVRPGSAVGLASVFQQGGGLVSMERLFSLEPPTIVRPTALYLNDTQFQQLQHQVTFLNPSTTGSRSWTAVHRPAFSVNGFEESNHYTPVNQSRLRSSSFGASSVVVTPLRLELGPGATGSLKVQIQPPVNLNVEERWLYSGYIEFVCTSSNGVACGSSLVSYGGMHGRLAGIPILNPTLSYPALQLDRNTKPEGEQPASAEDTKAPQGHRHGKQEPPHHAIQVEEDHHQRKAHQGSFSAMAKNDNKPSKGLYRDRKDLVMVGKNDQDWVQILISVNFPTGLLTIEAESVCPEDRGAGSGNNDRIRLEMGGSGMSRFQIETEEELTEAEQVVGSTDADEETIELMKERLTRSQELAFMPNGLYMPYAGYSDVMLKPGRESVSSMQPSLGLHRKNKKQQDHPSKKKKTKSKDAASRRRIKKLHSKARKSRGSKKHVEHHRKKSGHKKHEEHQGHKDTQGKNGGRRRGRGRGHGQNDDEQAAAPRRGDTRKRPSPPRAARPSPVKGTACVPRILGLIPSGYNPWSTRTDHSEGNTVQAFSWMGDLLLENHDAKGEEQGGLSDAGKTLSLHKSKRVTKYQHHHHHSKKVQGKGKGHGKHKGKGKGKGRGHHHKDKKKGQEQDEEDKQQLGQATRDLPDGRYRLVVKVLKPWGVRGRATDVERWSSPIIVIKRRK